VFPRATLAALAPGYEDAVGLGIPPASPTLRLLFDYVGALTRAGGPLPLDLARLAAGHIRDLVALAVGARGDAAQAARTGGGKAALTQAILRAIDEGATRPHLTPTMIAGRFGVSERRLRALLEEAGVSFSSRVLQRRLEQAWRQLGDPLRDRSTIADIALAAGFSDISYFNRCFRRRFGDSPSGVRAASLADPDETP
jgi:AraC-like DNA-binding protein